MTDVTGIVTALGQADPRTTPHLLPQVYDELRKLAAAKLALMGAGQKLEPTALVHEAYLRLADTDRAQDWNSRGHFFAAAAESMQRILVERARRRQCLKHGGHLKGHDIQQADIAAPEGSEDLIALDEALRKLEQSHAKAAQLVKLRFIAGLTNDQAADVLETSPRTAKRLWSYARAWLLREIRGGV